MSDIVAADDSLAEVIETRSFRSLAWRRFRRNRLAIFGLVVVILLVALAIIGPFLVQDPYTQERLLSKTGPDSRHWFGTDQLGRDEFARVVYGMRLSLMVGFAVAALQFFIGVTLGAMAGWVGRWVDVIVTRVIDIMLGIPYLVLAFAFIAVIGRGIGAVILTLAPVSYTHLTLPTNREV